MTVEQDGLVQELVAAMKRLERTPLEVSQEMDGDISAKQLRRYLTGDSGTGDLSRKARGAIRAWLEKYAGRAVRTIHPAAHALAETAEARDAVGASVRELQVVLAREGERAGWDNVGEVIASAEAIMGAMVEPAQAQMRQWIRELQDRGRSQ